MVLLGRFMGLAFLPCTIAIAAVCVHVARLALERPDPEGVWLVIAVLYGCVTVVAGVLAAVLVAFIRRPL